MRAARVKIDNFRGIKQATIFLPKHGVLIGDNNTGKTTILEALDLVLGPDRLNRQPPIDEHDFFRGAYTVKPAALAIEAADGSPAPQAVEVDVALPPSRIAIEVTVTGLTEEQKGKFGDYIEFWDSVADTLYDEPNPAGVDAADITEALRVTFHGWYDAEEDDFDGKTYFTRSLTEGDKPELFSRKHKQLCGFLYLRSIRTGSRALSLERGSLLDIILRLKEVRPQMWEDTLGTLSAISVASDPVLGISAVLESINTALKKYVPKEWGVEHISRYPISPENIFGKSLRLSLQLATAIMRHRSIGKVRARSICSSWRCFPRSLKASKTLSLRWKNRRRRYLHTRRNASSTRYVSWRPKPYLLPILLMCWKSFH